MRFGKWVVRIQVLGMALVCGSAFCAISTQALADEPPFTAEWFQETTDCIERIDSLELTEDFDDLDARFQILRDRRALKNDTGAPALHTAYLVLATPAAETDESYQTRVDHLKKWLGHRPDSPTAAIALANTYTQWAWHARGGGVAGTVKEDAWPIFRSRVAEALKLLLPLDERRVRDGELYAKLVEVGVSAGTERETVNAWVDKGREIAPYYFPLYDNMARYLQPRWHGEPGDIQEFAREICNRIGGDDGLEAYARIALSTNYYDRPYLIYGEYDPELLRKGAKVILDRRPKARYLVNFAGYVAWRTQDWELARQAKKHMTDDYIPERIWLAADKAEFDRFCGLQQPPGRSDLLSWNLYPVAATDMHPTAKALIAAPAIQGAPFVMRDSASLKPLGQFAAFAAMINDMVVDPRGDRVAIAYQQHEPSSSAALVIDLTGEVEPLHLYDAALGPCGKVRYSPDGKTLATLHADDKVGVWNTETGKLSRRIEKARIGGDLYLSPDGNRLVTKMGQVWDLTTGKEVPDSEPAVRKDGWTRMFTVGIREDGKILTSIMKATSSGDKTNRKSALAAIDLSNNSLDIVAEFERIPANCVLSASGRLVASTIQESQTDGFVSDVEVTDLMTGKRLALFPRVYSVRDFEFSLDDRQLLVVCHDHAIRGYKLPVSTNTEDK